MAVPVPRIQVKDAMEQVGTQQRKYAYAIKSLRMSTTDIERTAYSSWCDEAIEELTRISTALRAQNNIAESQEVDGIINTLLSS